MLFTFTKCDSLVIDIIWGVFFQTRFEPNNQMSRKGTKAFKTDLCRAAAQRIAKERKQTMSVILEAKQTAHFNQVFNMNVESTEEPLFEEMCHMLGFSHDEPDIHRTLKTFYRTVMSRIPQPGGRRSSRSQKTCLREMYHDFCSLLHLWKSLIEDYTKANGTPPSLKPKDCRYTLVRLASAIGLISRWQQKEKLRLKKQPWSRKRKAPTLHYTDLGLKNKIKRV